MFLQLSVILCIEGCLADTPMQTSPLGRHPPGQTCPRADRDGHCSERYTSYWNAFLHSVHRKNSLYLSMKSIEHFTTCSVILFCRQMQMKIRSIIQIPSMLQHYSRNNQVVCNAVVWFYIAGVDSSDDKHEPVYHRQPLTELTGHSSVVIAADWLPGGRWSLRHGIEQPISTTQRKQK